MTSGGNDDGTSGGWDAAGNPLPPQPQWDHAGNPVAPAPTWDHAGNPVPPIAPLQLPPGWTPAHPAGIPDTAGRLPLGEEDRLPWLESAGGEEYERIDGKRVAGVVIAGLAALAAIVGGLWWGTHHSGGGAPVADGSTVAAPPTPYKEAPKAPGGKTFAGTDDTSFAVSQGKQVQEHLAEGGSTAQSAAAVASDAAGASFDPANGGKAAAGGDGDDTTAAPPAAPAHAAAKPVPVVAAAGEGDAWNGGIVQIGAYYAQARAAQAWDELGRNHDVLKGARYRIVSAQVDSGTVWRLQLLTPAGGGIALCGRLKAAGLACQVKR